MGNGRESGRSPRSSGSVGLVQVLGAMLVLLLAGAALVGSGSRHYAQKATAELPESPFQAAPFRASAQSSPRRPDARAILGQLPLIFEPNQGQADASVKFLSRGAGYSLFLDANGAVLGLRTARSSSAVASERLLRMKLVGANAAVAASGTDPLPGKSNYFIGNDPRQWHRDIPQFAGVRYENVYRGIDLVFYGNQGHLEYDFRIAPGADAAQAELQFDVETKLELSGGDLILTGEEEGGVRLHAPQIYQTDGDRRKPVAGRFVLRADNRVGFEIAAYDHNRELVIDPLLDFSTYFGGSLNGSGTVSSPSVAANGDGNIYLAGSTTTDIGFPIAGTTIGSTGNVFVAKIDPSSPPVVVYLTFLGGNGSDTSVGLGVDNTGYAYIAGNTTSTNFPTAGIPYQPPPKGAQCASITCSSVFVSVLNPAGSSLNYSTYVAGNGNDIANAMTIDSNRDVFLIGNTTSNDVPSLTDAFPATYLPKPFQSSPASSLQLFVTKVNTGIPGVGGIAYSTYFGGTSPAGAVATGGGIAVDSTGNIYFSGTTNFYNSGSGLYGNSGTSGDFPILNAYQPCLDTVPPTILSVTNPCAAPATYPTDAFVAKINPNGQTGSQLLFSTYFGGTASDSSAGLAIDSGAANIYITGSTNSSDFVIPTGTAAFDTCLNNANPIGSTAACSTANTTDTDAYVARFSNPAVSTTGTPLDVAFTYFSYLGGSGNDSGLAIAVDTASDALVTGFTQSNNFPVTVLLGPIQSSLNGTQDAFFARINTTTISGQNGVGSYVTYFGGSGVDSGTSIAVDPVSLNTYFAGQTNSTDLHVVNPLQATLPGVQSAFLAELGTVANLCITCVAPIVSPLGTAPVGQPVSVTFTLTNEGPDVATGIGIRGSVSNSNGVTFNSGTAGSGTCSAPASNEVVCTIPTLQPGSTSSIVFSVTPIVAGSFDATATVFEVNNTNSNLVESAPFTVSDYFVTVSPAGQTVPAGQLAQYSVTVSPKGVFSGSVSLTCSSLPPSTTSNFSNSTLTFNGGNTSTTLFLQTTPQPVNVASSQPWQRPFYALWIMIPGMAIWGLGAGGKTRRGRWLGGLALFVFFALVLVQPSCSHSSRTPAVPTGTPSGTYSLTVTATSGSFSTSQGFQLTVIP